MTLINTEIDTEFESGSEEVTKYEPKTVFEAAKRLKNKQSLIIPGSGLIRTLFNAKESDSKSNKTGLEMVVLDLDDRATSSNNPETENNNAREHELENETLFQKANRYKSEQGLIIPGSGLIRTFFSN